MSINTLDARRLGRADHSSNSDCRVRASFARQATIAAFGWRHGRALDQADFVDRLPGETPLPSPETRLK